MITAQADCIIKQVAHVEIIWTPRAEEKIAEHGVTVADVEQVLRHPARQRISRSTGRPVILGRTQAGRLIAVVFEWVDDITVLPITAYEPSKQW